MSHSFCAIESAAGTPRSRLIPTKFGVRCSVFGVQELEHAVIPHNNNFPHKIDIQEQKI